jgi:hypothetical protein
MEQFNKRCRGDYDKTIEYKITHAGDAITDRFNNSNLGKSDFIKKLNEKLNKWHISLNKKIDSRSAILRAMRDTPSIPEMEMVRGQANGMKGLQLFDYPQLQKKFLETVKHPEDLDCYGADKDFINKVKNLISSTSSKESKLKYIQDAEFELLSKKPEYIDDAAKTLDEFKMMGGTDRIKVLQNMKAKASGYTSFAEWESLEKNIQERIPRVIEALHNSDKNMFTRMWTHDHNIIGKAQGEFFGRKVYTSETLNKLISELGSIKHDTQLQDVLQRTGLIKQVPKSALGRFFGKYMNLLLEGSTNRVAGGKLVGMMQAYFLAEAIIRTVQADKGDKVSTFMERLTELVAFFAAMPLAIQVMHKVGGLQYIGMNKEKVAEYRKALALFNENVKNGKLTDKAAYKVAKDDLQKIMKDSYKGTKKNIFTRLAHKTGQILTTGLEQIRPYTKHAVEDGLKGKLKDIFRNPKYWSKELGGSGLRLLAVLGMIMPFFSKTLVKGTHLIFGKPKHSVLDEGKEDKKQDSTKQLTPEQQAQLAQLQEAIRQQQQQNVKNNPQPVQPVQGQQQTNGSLLDKYKNNTQTNSIEPERHYMPSPTPAIPAEGTRAYMPSPNPVNAGPETQDRTKADQALANADNAERMVMQTLNMK